MGNATLIIGESGSGKSTSIRNLNPESTFIISVLDKPLPFKGYKSKYRPVTKENPNGNYYASDNHDVILKCIKSINARKDISVLILDDFQYVMANEFMRRSSERGFDRFSDIANHAWSVIKALTETRDDLLCFVMCHSDLDGNGRAKCKTIGKMLDDKITLEGMFTVVLHALVVDEQHKFLTQHSDSHLAKSPMDLFPERMIDNDLKYVVECMNEYFEI